MSARTLYTYFAVSKATGLWKIGRSYSVLGRVTQLAAKDKSIELRFVIFASIHSEMYCHQLFKAHRQEGEWFRDCPAIQTFIAQHQSKCVPLSDLEPVHGLTVRLTKKEARQTKSAAAMEGVSADRWIANVVRAALQKNLPPQDRPSVGE